MPKCFQGHEYKSSAPIGFDQVYLNAPACPECYRTWCADQFFNPGRIFLTSASMVVKK